MKHVALVLALALSVAATARPADACGGRPRQVHPNHESAVGVWPEVTRGDGTVTLRLSYPKFARSGDHLYAQTFTLVNDGHVGRLERVIAGPGGRALEVTVEEMSPGRWRVVSWSSRK